MAHYAVYFSDGSLLDTSIFEVAEKYDAVNVRRNNLEATVHLNVE